MHFSKCQLGKNLSIAIAFVHRLLVIRHHPHQRVALQSETEQGGHATCEEGSAVFAREGKSGSSARAGRRRRSSSRRCLVASASATAGGGR